jgi:hypothetical protein
MEGLARREAIEELDAANFDHPMSLVRVEAGGLSVEHDLAHSIFLPPPSREG